MAVGIRLFSTFSSCKHAHFEFENLELNSDDIILA